jgi:hypothetical protein
MRRVQKTRQQRTSDAINKWANELDSSQRKTFK